ncbi:GDSL-type esterase/lipase family protein [Planomicrobium sp. CPCC 101110]|uniref:SGNH/GDSL hydrolase family protein n=1 Tax=Planomicrobium sp. CPCC 101110 TaxID=2599619 RepID=UPI001645B068|nr:GDSL-type esterase/lipase family protein [Planomicrobium sp. CPCC 101110]
MIKKRAVLTVILLFGTAACGQQEIDSTVDYVALGDSLAAGQTPYSEIDAGYADLIAEELESQEQLEKYTKELAVPGYTTDDILKQLETENAKETVQTADLITISAGANDLLRLVRVDPASGELGFDRSQAEEKLDDVRINMETMLAELRKQAPVADIYVLGYYFPFPHLQDNQKAELEDQLDRLNEILEGVAEQQEAKFVPVDEEFGENAIDKLPNAADIHPNREGYEAMADAFWDRYKSR